MTKINSKDIGKGKKISAIVAVISMALLLTTPIIAEAAKRDIKVAVNSNKTEVGSKGSIDVITPSISSTADHRDYMVYVVKVDTFTFGAGLHFIKSGTSVVSHYLAYSFTPSQGVIHTTGSPGPTGGTVSAEVSEDSQNGTCWTGKSLGGTGGSGGIQIGKCFPAGSTDGIPGASSRAFSTSATGNTLREHYNNLQFAHWSGGAKQWLFFNDASVSETKCNSNSSFDPNGWVIDFLTQEKEFGTGPPFYTIDDCTNDLTAWEPQGE